MKSHMLIKHKDDQTECLKCKKKFPTIKDLNDRIKKAHNRNLHSCSHCEAKFLEAHALKQHVKAVHKEAQILPVGHPERAAKQNVTGQTSSTGFKCRNCQKSHTSGAMLDKHLGQCAPDQTRLLCKFFAEGRCTRGRWCKFSHHIQGNHPGAPPPPPASRHTAHQRNQECKRGPQCTLCFART